MHNYISCNSGFIYLLSCRWWLHFIITQPATKRIDRTITVIVQGEIVRSAGHTVYLMTTHATIRKLYNFRFIARNSEQNFLRELWNGFIILFCIMISFNFLSLFFKVSNPRLIVRKIIFFLFISIYFKYQTTINTLMRNIYISTLISDSKNNIHILIIYGMNHVQYKLREINTYICSFCSLPLSSVTNNSYSSAANRSQSDSCYKWNKKKKKKKKPKIKDISDINVKTTVYYC